MRDSDLEDLITRGLYDQAIVAIADWDDEIRQHLYSNIVYVAKGEYKAALEHTIPLVEYFDNVDSPTSKLAILVVLLQTHFRMRNLEKAQLIIAQYYDLLDRGVIIFAESIEEDPKLMTGEDADILFWRIRMLMAIGGVAYAMGTHTEANEKWMEVLHLIRNSPYEWMETNVLNNLGIVARSKGDLDKALDYFARSLSLAIKDDHLKMTGMALHNISTVYAEMQDHEQTLNYLVEALKYKEKDSDPNIIASSIYGIIDLHLETGNREEALLYLDKFEELRSIHPKSTMINFLLSISMAHYLGTSDEPTDVHEASTIYDSIFKGPLVDFNYQLLAMIQQIEILLDQFAKIPEEDLLHQMYDLLDRIKETALAENRIPLIISSMSLSARLSFVLENYSEGLVLLEQAIEVANKYHRQQSLNQLQELKIDAQDKVKIWKEILRKDGKFDLDERIDSMELLMYLEDLKKMIKG